MHVWTKYVATSISLIFYLLFLLREDANLDDEISSVKAAETRHTELLPEACRAYIVNNGTTLDLSQGRYIHVPGRQASYDHTCFIMRPRYNCATNDSSKPKAYEWKFVLQSDPDDPATLCDIVEFADELGGPGSDLLRDKQVGLFGDSHLRQLFEAVACKYQSQLTKLVLHGEAKRAPQELMENGTLKLITVEEFGTSFPLEVSNSTLPTCHGDRKQHEPFYSIPLPSDTLFVGACDDNIATAEYRGSLQLYYFFRPYLYDRPVEILNSFVGLSSLSRLDYIAYSATGFELKARAPETVASWDDFTGLHYLLRATQRRDIGSWFGADNPWITDIPVDPHHGCMDGPPTDGAAILLFSIMFDIHLLKTG